MSDVRKALPTECLTRIYYKEGDEVKVYECPNCGLFYDSEKLHDLGGRCTCGFEQTRHLSTFELIDNEWIEIFGETTYE